MLRHTFISIALSTMCLTFAMPSRAFPIDILSNQQEVSFTQAVNIWAGNIEAQATVSAPLLQGTIKVHIELTKLDLDCATQSVSASAKLTVSGKVTSDLAPGQDIAASGEHSIDAKFTESGASGNVGGRFAIKGTVDVPDLSKPPRLDGTIPTKTISIPANVNIQNAVAVSVGLPTNYQAAFRALLNRLCPPGSERREEDDCCCCICVVTYKAEFTWDPCTCTYIVRYVPKVECHRNNQMVAPGSSGYAVTNPAGASRSCKASPTHNVMLNRHFADEHGVPRTEVVWVTRDFAATTGLKTGVKMLRHYRDAHGIARRHEIFVGEDFAKRHGYKPKIDTISNRDVQLAKTSGNRTKSRGDSRVVRRTGGTSQPAAPSPSASRVGWTRPR